MSDFYMNKLKNVLLRSTEIINVCRLKLSINTSFLSLLPCLLSEGFLLRILKEYNKQIKRISLSLALNLIVSQYLINSQGVFFITYEN